MVRASRSKLSTIIGMNAQCSLCEKEKPCTIVGWGTYLRRLVVCGQCKFFMRRLSVYLSDIPLEQREKFVEECMPLEKIK